MGGFSVNVFGGVVMFSSIKNTRKAVDSIRKKLEVLRNERIAHLSQNYFAVVFEDRNVPIQQERRSLLQEILDFVQFWRKGDQASYCKIEADKSAI